MPSLKKLNPIVKTYVQQAISVMEKEYHKSDRVKLTHLWLAEKLGISKHLAFAVLAKVAQKKKMCRRVPNGPIYWDNEMVQAGEILDAVIGNQNQEEDKPKHKLYLVE